MDGAHRAKDPEGCGESLLDGLGTAALGKAGRVSGKARLLKRLSG
jgi:hypothetical protein